MAAFKRARVLPLVLMIAFASGPQSTISTSAAHAAASKKAGAKSARAATPGNVGARIDSLKAFLDRQENSRAETDARALLAELEAASGPDSLLGKVLDALVQSIWLGGMNGWSEGRQLAERTVALKERLYGHDHAETAGSLTGYGVLLSYAGDYTAALVPLRRVVAIYNKIERDGPNHLNSINNLANTMGYAGEYEGACQMYEQILEIQRRTVGPEHETVGRTLMNLAHTKVEGGDYAAAIGIFKESIASLEKSSGPEYGLVGAANWGLGKAQGALGDYAVARTSIEHANSIIAKVYGAEHVYVSIGLDRLAELLYTGGDYTAARPLYERALAMVEKSLGPDHPSTARALMGLATLLRTTGDLAAARPLFERSMALREKIFGPNSAEVAVNLGDLGDLQRDLGDDDTARRLYEKSLAINEKALGPDNPGVAVSLENLASLMVRAGEDATAKPLFERALTIRRNSLGPEHPLVAESQNHIATVLARQGQVGEGVEQALEAERISRDHLRLTSRSLSERQALRYSAVRSSSLDLLLTLAGRGLDPASDRRVMDAAVRSRAVVLDEMAARHRAIADTSNARVASLADTLAGARARLAALVVRGIGDQSPTAYRKLIEDAQAAKEAAERTLAATSADFARGVSRARLGLDEVAANLPAGSALVAMTEYEKAELTIGSAPASAAGRVGPSKRGTHFMAFVLRAGERDPQAVELGSADAIDSLVTRWKQEVSGGALRAGMTPKRAEAAYRTAGTALRARVWDPLTSALAHVERVFVVPDGSLNLVNLAALPIDEGGYLVERGPSLHYLSAERDLVPAGESRHGAGLLALGAPDYEATAPFASLRQGGADSTKAVARDESSELIASAATYRGQRSGCGDFATTQFEPLPATGEETREIVGMWTKSQRAKSAERAGILDLTGGDASEAAFKRSVAGRSVLHLATHGFFISGACPSALAPARGIGGLTTAENAGAESPPPVGGENPLLLSGLVLAGANHRAAAGEGEDDGILTAEEIASLDLSGVEWAVLSACETGVGDVQTGEGVFGLRRAFQVAGAGTLIMSLWSVDDEATRAWMKALYEARLKNRRDTVDAARNASLSVLRDRRKHKLATHPFYWAAFVAAGDWR